MAKRQKPSPVTGVTQHQATNGVTCQSVTRKYALDPPYECTQVFHDLPVSISYVEVIWGPDGHTHIVDIRTYGYVTEIANNPLASDDDRTLARYATGREISPVHHNRIMERLGFPHRWYEPKEA